MKIKLHNPKRGIDIVLPAVKLIVSGSTVRIVCSNREEAIEILEMFLEACKVIVEKSTENMKSIKFMCLPYGPVVQIDIDNKY